jgi:hypothetical protein
MPDVQEQQLTAALLSKGTEHSAIKQNHMCILSSQQFSFTHIFQHIKSKARKFRTKKTTVFFLDSGTIPYGCQTV